MYKDVHDYYKSCDACQITRGLTTQSLVKLVIYKFSKGTICEMGIWFCGANQANGKIYKKHILLLPQIMLLSGWEQKH